MAEKFNPFADTIEPKEEIKEESVQEQPKEESQEPVQEAEEKVDEPKEVEGKEADVEKTEKEEVDKPEAKEESTDEQGIEFFNKKYNTEFKSEDELKEVLSSPTKVKEYEDKYNKLNDEYSGLQEKYDAFKKYEDGFDPLEPFFTPEDYLANQYLKENPDKNRSIVSEAFFTDFKDVNDMDVLVKYEKLNDPSANDDVSIREMIAEQFNIDTENIDNPSEWTRAQKARIQKEANLARKEFNEMKKSVDLPEKKDILAMEKQMKEEAEAKKEALKKDWTGVTDAMMTDFDKVPVYDDPDKDGNREVLAEFALDDKMKSEVRENILSYLTDRGLEVNEDNIKEANETAHAMIYLKNLPTILKGVKNEALAAQEEKHNKEIHNPEKPKVKEKPPQEDNKKGGLKDALSGTPYRSVRRKVI